MKKLEGTPAEGLFGATLGFFTGFAAVSLFGPTAVKFKEVMHLSPMLVAFLIAMPSLSGSLLRIPFSAWVDTTGGRKPFLILLMLSILGMSGLFFILFFLYPDHLSINLYPLLLLLGLLSGCGIATFSVGASQVAYWYPKKKQGIALGTYAGVGNLAPGLFSFLLPFALINWGLGGSYLAWLVFLLIGTFLYFLSGRNAWFFQLIQSGTETSHAKELAREKGQELFPSGSIMGSLKISTKTWKTWALVGIYFTTFGGFIALTAWFPTYWREYFSVTAVQAGLLTAVYSILTSLFRVAGGNISDRLGGEITAIASLTIMLAGVFCLMFSGEFALSVAGEILMAFGMGVSNAAVFKLVPQEVPEAVGGASGWVGGIGAFGGFAIPPLLGLFVQSRGNIGYVRGFVVFLILAILSILLAFLLKKTGPGTKRYKY
ncbi:MAG: MFS transporter [Deltaproteobacteria bacterium RIFCSPLOWO2_02_FULL_46_8]|nr:MAG: MFS transporter [Deltaproteobacteria bacterium RIFCSPLOWO2_02_FULL_46_8]